MLLQPAAREGKTEKLDWFPQSALQGSAVQCSAVHSGTCALPGLQLMAANSFTTKSIQVYTCCSLYIVSINLILFLGVGTFCFG